MHFYKVWNPPLRLAYVLEKTEVSVQFPLLLKDRSNHPENTNNSSRRPHPEWFPLTYPGKNEPDIPLLHIKDMLF